MSGKSNKNNGNKSRYTKAAGARICAAIAEGQTLRQAAAAEGVSHAVVLKWVQLYPAFGEEYAAALELRLSLFEDQLVELCAEADEAARDDEHGALRLRALQLRIDTLKWQLSKLRPKRYGDRQAVELTGKDGAAVEVVQHSPEQLAAFARQVAQAREELRKEGSHDQDGGTD